MGQLRTESIFQKLEKVTPKYIARFIIWYYTPEEKRCPFKQLMPYEPNVKDLETCMDWLTREDAQDAMQIYHKHMKKYKLMQIYDTMFDKAMTGDVNAAKWVETFSSSDFFDETTDEMESFMKNVNISALKKGGGKNGSK